MKEEKYWILLSKKIVGEATAEELKQLQELINNNPEWKKIEENLLELWSSKPRDTYYNKLQKKEDTYLLHINRLKEKATDFKEKNDLAGKAAFDLTEAKRPFYTRWITYVAAAVFIIFIIILYPLVGITGKTNKVATSTAGNEITVNPGAKTKLRLPDGTHVWVNSDSKLSYSGTFKGPLREVYLDGEAYFDVVKDKTRPFIVHTGGIDIRVLGTAFNVKAYKTESTIEATLIHGLIEVTKPDQPDAPKVILKPHEKLIFDKYAADENKKTDEHLANGNFSKEEIKKPAITIAQIANNIVDSAIIETSWVYNRLSFEDEKFDNIALKMERWFNVKITINNDKIKSYKLTGSFENETIDEALKELQYLITFSYKITGREIEINKK
jgi:ferric-dicitrate binding protein FerR (iron transport regulator)